MSRYKQDPLLRQLSDRPQSLQTEHLDLPNTNSKDSQGKLTYRVYLIIVSIGVPIGFFFDLYCKN